MPESVAVITLKSQTSIKMNTTVNFTPHTGNMYMDSVIKACEELILEECEGNSYPELRLKIKLEAARALFPHERRQAQHTKIILNRS